jgi:hypothetical protein
MSNNEYRISKVDFASGFAFGYDPTGRPIFLSMTGFIIRSRRGRFGFVGWVEPTEGSVGFVALNPTYVLPVLSGNAKPNSG